MKKNKIYIITECPYVGVFVAIIELSRILKDLWFEITFLLPIQERNRYWEKQLENEYILNNYWSIVRIPLRRSYKYLISDIYYLKNFLMWNSTDIFISYTNYAWKISRLLYMFWIITNLYHVPSCIQNKRFVWFSKYFEWFIERVLANQTKYYLSCWPSESYILLNKMKVWSDKILLFPNFRSVDFHHKKKIEYDYIYVGRMTRDKWVERILETFSLNWILNKIVFIWGGWELKKWKIKYPNANFLWRLTNSDVLSYLSRSKFFISASVMEWMPYTLIESMWTGIVPIVSNVEWHKDLIIDGYNWFMFDSDLDLVNIVFKSKFISEEKYNELSILSKKTIDNLKENWIMVIKEHFSNIN